MEDPVVAGKVAVEGIFKLSVGPLNHTVALWKIGSAMVDAKPPAEDLQNG
jgi:hypothetical protein